MKKYSQSSIVDFLIDNLPQFKNQLSRKYNTNVSAANTLFGIWKNKKNQVNSMIYKKTNDISKGTVEDLQNAGFIKIIGDKLHITAKGSDIIKTMILGDDRSVYEENGKDIDFKFASEYVKTPSRMKKTGKKAEDQFWKSILSQKIDNSFETEKFQFTEGEEKARAMTDEQINFAIKDLQEVIAIQEKTNREGGYTPKLGYYYDELHTLIGEKYRRKNQRLDERRNP